MFDPIIAIIRGPKWFVFGLIFGGFVFMFWAAYQICKWSFIGGRYVYRKFQSHMEAKMADVNTDETEEV